MKKLLIVSGDSNTDENFTSVSHPDRDFSFKKWPELLADKLNMKVVNMAKVGQGNEYIYTTLRNKITSIEYKQKIGLVIAAWSEAPRKDYKKNMNTWTSLRVDTHGKLYGWVEKTLGHYLDFQILCERYDIPYAHFQIMDLFEHYLEGIGPSQSDIEKGANPYNDSPYIPLLANRLSDEKKLVELVIKYGKILNTSKFIGWPPLKKLKGYRIKDLINIWDLINKKSSLRVSEFDAHPNKQGHIAIYEKIYQLLRENRIIN